MEESQLPNLMEKKFFIEKIHSFGTDPIFCTKTLYTDILQLYKEVERGVLIAKNQSKEDITSLGIDSWTCLKENDLDSARLFIKDKLHQPYRKVIYGDLIDLVELLIDEYKIPAAISGAGPSVICIINNINLNRVKNLIDNLENIILGYRYLETSICYDGSIIS